MRNHKLSLVLFAALSALFLFLACAIPVLAANTEQVLYSFCFLSGCTDGLQPAGDLIFDADGNLYGATTGGGAYGYGTAFELTPGADGAWTEAVLYSFRPNSGCGDRAYPIGGLIFDTAGNLYGATADGGSNGPTCAPTSGCGTVFELAPAGNGTWTERVLHTFHDNGKDGFEPAPGLIFDAAGNLYGATSRGGSGKGVCGVNGCGTVFKLKPNTNGTWTETVLHTFCHVKNCAGDGVEPMAGLILGAGGSLYGTTDLGGAPSKHCNLDCGIVFQLTPGTNGKWSEKVLHSFNGDNGRNPQARLILDAKGNLYGTTETIGTVFELSKPVKGAWTEKVLHRFGTGTDGVNPSASLIFDAVGNLYGTTFGGGASSCPPNGAGCGIVFHLSPQSNGKWTENILHDFQSNGQDGTGPHAGIIFDTAGNLYSTTGGGGTGPCENSLGEVVGCGTVFEITP